MKEKPRIVIFALGCKYYLFHVPAHPCFSPSVNLNPQNWNKQACRYEARNFRCLTQIYVHAVIIQIVRNEDRPFLNAYRVLWRLLQGAASDARHLPFELIPSRVAYGILLPLRMRLLACEKGSVRLNSSVPTLWSKICRVRRWAPLYIFPSQAWIYWNFSLSARTFLERRS